MDKRNQNRKGDRFGLVAFITVGVIVVLVLGAGIWQGLRPLVAKPAAGVKQVQISMSGFAPNVIRVKAGEPTRIALVDLDDSNHIDGGGWHNFNVPKLHITEKVAPLSTKVFTLDIKKPGTYRFYCNICCGGSADPSMNGLLVVKA